MCSNDCPRITIFVWRLLMIYRVKKPLGETSKLLRSRVTLVLQTSVLVPQTTHFVLQGKPSTSFSGYSQFKGGQMRLQVRHRISETQRRRSIEIARII